MATLFHSPARKSFDHLTAHADYEKAVKLQHRQISANPNSGFAVANLLAATSLKGEVRPGYEGLRDACTNFRQGLDGPGRDLFDKSRLSVRRCLNGHRTVWVFCSPVPNLGVLELIELPDQPIESLTYLIGILDGNEFTVP